MTTEQQDGEDMTLLGSFPSPARSTCSASLFSFVFLFSFFNVCLILVYVLQFERELQPKIMLPSQGDWHTLLGVCSKSRGFK